LLWTDGLSDALNAAGERYGVQRLEQLVSGVAYPCAEYRLVGWVRR
jgi:serine phosphatase RsbU (regulator of sigma subunit)